MITGFGQVPIAVTQALAVEDDLQPAAQDRGARQRGHVVQQPSADLHLLHWRGDRCSRIGRAVYLVIRRVFFGILLPGWASLIVSMWLLGGLILFCLGVIGIYLSKIFIETKQRPYTIVRNVHERTADPAEPRDPRGGRPLLL